MAAVTKTAANVRLVYADQARLKSGLAAEALVRGDVVYLNSAGRFARADSDAVATMPGYGAVTNDAGAAGDPVTVLIDGWLAGFDLAAHNPGTPLWVAGTAGGLDTTKPSAVGSVEQMFGIVDVDANGNKLLRVAAAHGVDFVVN